MHIPKVYCDEEEKKIKILEKQFLPKVNIQAELPPACPDYCS